MVRGRPRFRLHRDSSLGYRPGWREGPFGTPAPLAPPGESGGGEVVTAGTVLLSSRGSVSGGHTRPALNPNQLPPSFRTTKFPMLTTTFHLAIDDILDFSDALENVEALNQ